jgi:hypothetical protein
MYDSGGSQPLKRHKSMTRASRASKFGENLGISSPQDVQAVGCAGAEESERGISRAAVAEHRESKLATAAHDV